MNDAGERADGMEGEQTQTLLALGARGGLTARLLRPGLGTSSPRPVPPR